MKNILTQNTLASDIGSTVQVSGWVHKRRDHGGIIFIDLRDSQGIVQLVFNGENNNLAYQTADQLRNEFVIQVVGKIEKRSSDTINSELPTGKIEIIVDEIIILNTCKSLPFSVSEYDNTKEETRLKYRYLDLRKTKSRHPFFVRSKINKAIRNFLDSQEFTEIETPILTKATPEGARDFLVPSRIHPGHFYALPQSPQLFKQLFMMSGFYRYFQFARCFRDEDLRADRQPEFTQLDMELSFAKREDIIDVIQRMFQFMLKEVYNIDISLPIPHMTYEEAMTQYGTDRPDLRFDLKLVNIKSVAENCEFSVFKNAIKNNGIVYGINVKNGASFSRSQIETYTQYVAQFGAKGLAFMKVTSNGLESSITKFFTPEQLKELQTMTNAQDGDLLFFIADQKSVTFQALGNLRNKLSQDLNLIKNPSELNFVWIVDFPLFEYSSEEKRYVSVHHPFTSPHPDDLKALESEDFENVRAQAYDLVLNGTELGGGSVRIHSPQLQKKMFQILKLSEDDIQSKFGFFIEALEYGAPPHAGIAFGMDRVVMLLEKLNSIREVIAFPKTQKGQCLLTDSPSFVSTEQLKELHIKTVQEKKE